MSNKENEGNSKYRYNSDWIRKLESEEHWRSYWYQLKIMDGKIGKEDKILEIGPGTHLITNYLKSKGYNIITLDIDANKRPDIVANICQFTPSNIYDHILAFQVFEHIPFDDFELSMEILANYCRKYFFISVPECCNILGIIDFKIPYVNRRIVIKKRRKKIDWSYHHWELYYKDITLKRFLDVFSKNNFILKHTEQFGNKHFFVFAANKY